MVSGPTGLYCEVTRARRLPSSSSCPSPLPGGKATVVRSAPVVMSTTRMTPSMTAYTTLPSVSTMSPSSTPTSWVLVVDELPAPPADSVTVRSAAAATVSDAAAPARTVAGGPPADFFTGPFVWANTGEPGPPPNPYGPTCSKARGST